MMPLPPIDRKLLYITIAVLVVVLGMKMLHQPQPPFMPFDGGMGNDGAFPAIGGPEPLAQTKEMAFDRSANSLAAAEQSAPDSGTADQRIIYTGSLNLIVETVESAADAITEKVTQLDGAIESSSISRGDDDIKTGYVTVRIPAARFEEAMQALADIGLEVVSRNSNASDITRQFVDLEARLKNAQAEETQYQTILERAQTVEDILNVTRALNEVRSRIEQMQAERNYLASQTDMATISVYLEAEGDTEVFGVRWRPLVVARQAARELVERFVEAGNTVIRLVILLPVLLLWVVIFSLIAYIVWKGIVGAQRYVARRSTRVPPP